jgi:large subunit ribosomal protein L7/L12
MGGHIFEGEDNMAAITNEQILDAIAEMKITEIADLIKAMEEKFGVTAAAPVAAAGAGPAAAAVEEKTEFTVILKGGVPADKKISIIKEVRAITGLGLKEAKDLVEAGDKALKENISKDESEKIKKQITDAGGAVEIK